ncbi:MAG: SHOCT domain-containing protein [Spirochaetia bacterium]|nr:SHOCT domain-containing protein [Spirochaetia bacterium]
MGIILILGIIAIAYIAYNNYQRNPSEWTSFSEDSSSLEIAKARYANGEISRDEYEHLKTELGY